MMTIERGVPVTSPQNHPSLAVRAPLLYRGASTLREDEPAWKQQGLLFVW